MKFEPMQLPSSSKVIHCIDEMREALGETAVDLPLDDHRVDAHAAVVHRHHAPHLPDAGVGVDLDGHA